MSKTLCKIGWRTRGDCPPELADVKSVVLAGVPRAGENVEILGFMNTVHAVIWFDDGSVEVRLR